MADQEAHRASIQYLIEKLITKTRGLLDLPAEILQQIYCECLTTQNDLNFHLGHAVREPDPVGPFNAPDDFQEVESANRSSFDSKYKNLRTLRDKPPVPSKDNFRVEGKHLSSQMLRVCRKFHDEGVRVLYGDNVFCTTGPSILSKTSDIGETEYRIHPRSASLIRSIHLRTGRYHGLVEVECAGLGLDCSVTLHALEQIFISRSTKFRSKDIAGNVITVQDRCFHIAKHLPAWTSFSQILLVHDYVMPDEQYIKLMEIYDSGGIKEEDMVDTERIKSAQESCYFHC